MLFYISLWLAATAIVDGKIWDMASGYQSEYDTAKANSEPHIFMDEFIKTIDATLLTEWLRSDGVCDVSEYSSPAEYTKYFENILRNDEISYKESDVANVYDIYSGNEVVASVRIGSNNVFDKFNFSGWKFLNAKVIPYMYDTFNKTIVVDKNYSVTINGKELSKDYIVKEKSTAMGEYMTGITGVLYGTYVYKIEGFLVEPEIIVVDKNGNKVENTSEAIDMAEFLSFDKNSMDSGKIQRVKDTFLMYFEHMNKMKTFEEMEAYLVKDTDAYELIKSAQKSLEWVTPVKKIEIVEQKIEDYVLYNENYFSCNLYMNVEKNYGYTTKNEYFDACVLFKKVDGQWYIDLFMLN